MLKKLKISMLIMVSGLSCFSQTVQEVENIITKNGSLWLESWEHNPLKNLEKKRDGKITNTFDYGGFFYVYDSNSPKNHLIVYSPSKMYSVDIYSRRISIRDSMLEYEEPDSEIILNDIHKEKSIRLLYEGSLGEYEEIEWISDTCFIVLGYRIGYDDDKTYPRIFVYDIKNFHYFCYDGLENVKKYDYIEEKFKRLRIIKGVRYD